VVSTSIAAGALTNSAPQGAFRAVVSHRGHSGDGWIELAAIAVRLEESAGDPFDPIQAASLVDEVQVYGDDGDNTFEAEVDPFLASANAAGIDFNGVVRVDLPDELLEAAIPPASQRTLFVVLDLANPILGTAPETLRLTLLTDGGSVCEADDREYQLPLTIQWRESLATATLAVLNDLFSDGFESADTSAWSATAP
jgi:hypothetical protein